jgi:transcriptional regulator with XRE-family HTH domain
VRLQLARRNRNGQRTNQDDLAETLGITRTSVSNIERGQHRVFLDQVYLAARALGVEPSALLPPMSEVFPEAAVDLAPDSKLTEKSVQLIAAIARDLQQNTKRDDVSLANKRAASTKQARRG